MLLAFVKIVHNIVPVASKSETGRYMFRTNNDFVEQDGSITNYKKSFLPFAFSLWNSLDENTRKMTIYESS